MIADLICKNEDEWFTPDYAIYPLLKYINKDWIIWCPFDEESSLFVKILKENGYKVIYSHLNEGKDFFNYQPEYYDCIISNPPYSKKEDCIKRCFELNKPFALLVGILGLFESKNRFNMFNNNQFEIMLFDKRICFFNNKGTTLLKSAPPFSSVYVCRNILPKQIVFEEVNKRFIIKR